MKLQRFLTNLATIPHWYYPDPPYKGRGWHLTFGPYFHPEGTKTHINGRIRVPRQIVIYAATDETAQNAVDLISSASCLVNEECGDDSLFDQVRAYRASKARVKQRDFDNDFIPPTRTGNYQFACMVAARASRRKAFQYALYKYKLSQQCFYTFTHALEPSEWCPQKFVFSSAEHHVRCAQAIALGYSVLEELGLEIRANQQNPSFIKGVWNPAVKAELEQRLTEAGIDLSEMALWTMRDTPTRIEHERPVPVTNKASWAFSKIRDSDVEVVDAIARASWLRSKVSAHRLHEISASLNYYDIANIHYLAGRLLLETLGLWRYHDFLYRDLAAS